MKINRILFFVVMVLYLGACSNNNSEMSISKYSETLNKGINLVKKDIVNNDFDKATDRINDLIIYKSSADNKKIEDNIDEYFIEIIDLLSKSENNKSLKDKLNTYFTKIENKIIEMKKFEK